MSTPNRDDVWITGLNWNTFHSVFSRPYLTKFQNTSKSDKKKPATRLRHRRFSVRDYRFIGSNFTYHLGVTNSIPVPDFGLTLTGEVFNVLKHSEN